MLKKEDLHITDIARGEARYGLVFLGSLKPKEKDTAKYENAS